MHAKRCSARRCLVLAASLLVVAFAPLASATTSSLVASGFNYVIFDTEPPTAILTVDSIGNQTDPPRISGELTLELWAFAGPFPGPLYANYAQTGYKLASYPLGRIAPNYVMFGVNSGVIPYTPPPPGTWYLTSIIVEYSATVGNGQLPREFFNFATPIVVTVPTTASPVPGLWLDPTQPGTGYSINVRHGVAVVIVYSHAAEGTPLWAIATGPLTGTNPQVFTAPLQTFTGGTCITCSGAQAPQPGANPGSIFISFTSPAAGTVSIVPTGTAFFAGGRTANIVPADF